MRKIGLLLLVFFVLTAPVVNGQDVARLRGQLPLISFVLLFFLTTLILLIVSDYHLRNRVRKLELKQAISIGFHDELSESLDHIESISESAMIQPADELDHQEILGRLTHHARDTMEKMDDMVWIFQARERNGFSLGKRMERYLFEICSARQLGCKFSGVEQLAGLRMEIDKRRLFYLGFKKAIRQVTFDQRIESIDVEVSVEDKRIALMIREYHREPTLVAEDRSPASMDKILNTVLEYAYSGQEKILHFEIS